ncbi:MAG: GIY-YIG nuclease family protein [Verrucomicrobiota bacterium]|nr:GIY-YIG nuclease family protein [Verrucomicrobiota bacterium]
MTQHQNYFVYMLANAGRNTVLYIGITYTIERRTGEHSLGWGSAFCRKYNAHKLVYGEAYHEPRPAIEREKQLKNWSRAKKDALIAKRNPEWRDLLLEMHSTKPVGGAR